jgi:2-keto-4-pentenoate hydratase
MVMDCKALGAAVAEHWVSRTSLPLLSPNLSMDQAVCIRDAFLAQIQPLMGRPLGYKAAVITPPAQRDLGLKEPLGGIYLAAMFRPADGATIPVTYGARPIVEAKLLAIVKDEAINDAQTVGEAARSIAFLLPSIELGDSLVNVDQKITAPILTVYNVGARAVLTGTPMPFDGTEAATEKLKRMTVTTRNVGSNTIVDQQSADVIMGNPMNAVLWIIRASTHAVFGLLRVTASVSAPCRASDPRPVCTSPPFGRGLHQSPLRWEPCSDERQSRPDTLQCRRTRGSGSCASLRKHPPLSCRLDQSRA